MNWVWSARQDVVDWRDERHVDCAISSFNFITTLNQLLQCQVQTVEIGFGVTDEAKSTEYIFHSSAWGRRLRKSAVKAALIGLSACKPIEINTPERPAKTHPKARAITTTKGVLLCEGCTDLLTEGHLVVSVR